MREWRNGRRAGLRSRYFGVWVQIPSPAPYSTRIGITPVRVLPCSYNTLFNTLSPSTLAKSRCTIADVASMSPKKAQPDFYARPQPCGRVCFVSAPFCQRTEPPRSACPSQAWELCRVSDRAGPYAVQSLLPKKSAKTARSGKPGRVIWGSIRLFPYRFDPKTMALPERTG